MEVHGHAVLRSLAILYGYQCVHSAAVQEGLTALHFAALYGSDAMRSNGNKSFTKHWLCCSYSLSVLRMVGQCRCIYMAAAYKS